MLNAAVSAGFVLTVNNAAAAIMEMAALVIKAEAAPNWLHNKPNNSDAGKTVIPKAKL